MNAERLERMIVLLLASNLTGDQQVMAIQAVCDEYRAWAERQLW